MRLGQIGVQIGRENIGGAVAKFAPGRGAVGKGFAASLCCEFILRFELAIKGTLREASLATYVDDPGTVKPTLLEQPFRSRHQCSAMLRHLRLRDLHRSSPEPLDLLI